MVVPQRVADLCETGIRSHGRGVELVHGGRRRRREHDARANRSALVWGGMVVGGALAGGGSPADLEDGGAKMRYAVGDGGKRRGLGREIVKPQGLRYCRVERRRRRKMRDFEEREHGKDGEMDEEFSVEDKGGGGRKR